MGYPACLYNPVSYPNREARHQHSSLNAERNLKNSQLNSLETSTEPMRKVTLTGTEYKVGKAGQTGWIVCAKQHEETGSYGSPLCYSM
jgi:hypothetical protein